MDTLDKIRIHAAEAIERIKKGIGREGDLQVVKIYLDSLKKSRHIRREKKMKEKKKQTTKICKYCRKPYTVNLVLGDINLGACNKAKCRLQSIRDNI